MKRVFVWLIRGYQTYISPGLRPCCRFTPTCSQYALEAFARHGFWRGGWLTLARLLRCRPGCRHGYDPVPDNPHIP